MTSSGARRSAELRWATKIVTARSVCGSTSSTYREKSAKTPEVSEPLHSGRTMAVFAPSARSQEPPIATIVAASATIGSAELNAVPTSCTPGTAGSTRPKIAVKGERPEYVEIRHRRIERRAVETQKAYDLS